ncbi:MAG: hypothetical protein HY606_11435 [Planctomycetes bacterium]|nr:hypothetical protein [Planctomycetota bacterium]
MKILGFLFLLIFVGKKDNELVETPNDVGSVVNYSSIQDGNDNQSSSKGTTFLGVDLYTITLMVQRLTGKQFIFMSSAKSGIPNQPSLPIGADSDDLKSAVVYYLSDVDYSKDPELFFKIYESLLEQAGFALVPVQIDKEKKTETFKIIKVRSASKTINTNILREKPFPVVTESTTEIRERIITRIFKLKFASPTQVQQNLNNTGFIQNTVIVPFEQEKVLMITDYDYNIKKFESMLNLMDVETVKPVMEVIRLKYSLATDVVKTLESIIPNLFIQQSRTTTPTQPQPYYQPQPQPSATTPSQGGMVIPDTRTNSVLVVAERERIDIITKIIIEELDVDLPDRETTGIYIYPLIHIKADEASQIIGNVMAGYLGEQEPSTQPTPTPNPTQPQPFPRRTPPGSTTRTPPGTQPTQPLNPGTSQPNTAPPVIGDKFRVIPDLRTNTLIIVSDRNTYSTIKHKVLDLIDKRAPQILLKVSVVEITSANDFDLGFELKRLVKARNNRFGFEYSHNFDITTIAPIDPANPMIDVLPKSINEVGATAFLIRDKLTKIPIILKAIEDKATGRILSEQELLTQTNQIATFTDQKTTNVAVTRTVATATGAVTNKEPYPVEATSVLNITPRITDTMEVDLNIAFQAQRFGRQADPELPPDTTSREIQINNIRVTNTQTVVIAGAASDTQTIRERRVPLLADIPLIGDLFKRRTTQDTVSRVYLFITPYILYDEKTGDLLKLSQSREALLQQVDSKLKVIEYTYGNEGFKTAFRFVVPLNEE